MFSEWFPCMYVGKVYFNERYTDAQERVPKCNAGVGECTWIDYDKVHILGLGLMDLFNQLIFSIALQTLHNVAEVLAAINHSLMDFLQT